MPQKIKFCIAVGFVFLFFPVNVSLAADIANELFALGQTAASQGEAAKAIGLYERSIEADPDFAPSYSALGQIYLDQNGPVDDIIWLFQQAADIEPQNAEHYTNMCRAYFQYQDFDWAEAACLKALSIDKNAGAAKLTLAYVYLLGKAQFADAIKYFKEVLTQIPNPKIYYGLGLAYARNHEQAKALDIITNLRGMGQETLASQLEKMIRPGGEPPVQAIVSLPNVETSPSGLVKDKPEIKPTAKNSLYSQPGVMHIKLKGKLSSTGFVPASAPDASKKASTPSDNRFNHEQPPESAVERLKKMRGNGGTARIRGTTTVRVQGTASVPTVPAAQ